MADQPFGSEFFRKMLAEVDLKSGKTKWDKLVETLREEAAKGTPGFAEQLHRAEACQAKYPEMTTEGQLKLKGGGNG